MAVNSYYSTLHVIFKFSFNVMHICLKLLNYFCVLHVFFLYAVCFYFYVLHIVLNVSV